MNLHIIVRYYRSKIRDRIRQAQSDLKGAELQEKITDKGLHNVFKVLVKESNNSFPILGESDS